MMIVTETGTVYSHTHLKVILFQPTDHILDYYTSELILEQTSQKSVWFLCIYFTVTIHGMLFVL